jgi:hypothetical protein
MGDPAYEAQYCEMIFKGFVSQKKLRRSTVSFTKRAVAISISRKTDCLSHRFLKGSRFDESIGKILNPGSEVGCFEPGNSF